MLDEFEKRIEMLITHFEKFNNLNEDVIERVVSSNGVGEFDSIYDEDNFILHGVGGKIIKAQSFNQNILVTLAKKNEMIFAIGPAGTGKTYTSVALAVKALKEKQVKRIILTRPAVEAGENLDSFLGILKKS